MSYTVWFGEAGGLLLKLNGDQEQSTGIEWASGAGTANVRLMRWEQAQCV